MVAFDGTAVALFELPLVLAVGTHDVGPFSLDPFAGFCLDITRSDDGTNGTLDIALLVGDPVLGVQVQLDGAGAAVTINGWAAGENVRRLLQVHPTAGPIPTDDVDGVLTVGTTGIATNYYRQPVLAPFWFRFAVGSDASTLSGATLYLLR